MADKDFKDSGLPEMNRYEHDRKNVGAKKVSLLGYLPGTDELVRITAVDNGDGTYSLKTAATVTIGEVEIKNDTGNPVSVSAATLPLPSGAATSAKQDTGNSSLSTIADNTNKDDTGFIYYSAALTAGATISPSTGSKAIEIRKVLVTNSSNNTTFRNVSLSSVSLGTFLQGEAIASSWRTLLATGEDLTITLGGSSGTVYVNIQYIEI